MSVPGTKPMDTDDLPPTQYLVLEVLAARHRTGEHMWTFPSRLRWALLALADAGLIGMKSGIAPRTYLAWLTEPGRTAALMDGYLTPNDKAPARLAAVWELYGRCREGPKVDSDVLVRRLGEALRGEA